MKKLLLQLLCVPLIGLGQIDNLPVRYSLEEYTPSSILQVGNMCESYALSTIRTILYAKNNNNTDSLWLEENRFSPFFLYYMYIGANNKKCTKFTRIDWDLTDDGKISKYKGLLQFVKDYGIAKMSDVESNEYYPITDKKLWKCYPSDSTDMKLDLFKAKKYRIDSFQFVGIANKKLGKSGIDSVKSNLFRGKPCWINVQLKGGKFSPERYWYDRELADKGVRKQGGHAMVIIAYDDKKYGGSFLVMNSYGQKWGIKGKIWIKYEDIKKLKGDRVISISCNKEIYESEDGSPNYLNQLTSKKFTQSFFPLYRNDTRKEVRSIPVFKYINSSTDKKCIYTQGDSINSDDYFDAAGITFSQNTSFSKNSVWIGAEVSLMSQFMPASIEKESVSVAFEGFTFGWSRNVSSNDLRYNNYDFNLLKIGSPITLSILKFGFLDAHNYGLQWYYKPDIGLGFGDFECFYSCNLFFKELDNNIHQKHMINFRFSKKLSSLWLAKFFDYNPK